MRARFFYTLNWEPGMTARGWLERVVETKDLGTWWRGVWKDQALQLSWIKWAYAPTRDWLLEFEYQPSPKSAMGPSALPVNSGMSHAELAGVAHPWFRPLIKWRIAEHEHTLLEEELVKLRQSIENRRRAALQWFAPLEIQEGGYSREDWTLWERLHRDNPAKKETAGRITAWFDSLAK